MSNNNGFDLTRRRILGGVATVGAASAAAGAGTMALFSDTESSSGNTVQAGTLDLEVGSSDSLGIDVSGKAPGWSDTYQANVDNSGSTGGNLRVDVNVVSVGDGATPESEENYAQSNGMLDEVWIKLGFGGSTDIIQPATSLGTAEMLGELDALRSLAGQSGTTLDVEVGIDTDATNEIQGDEIEFEVVISLLQKDPITVGSAGADYSSIQAAVDAASAGDTVKLVDSSYSESFTISNDSIGLYGQGATIDVGGANRGVVVNADDATLSGVEITNADPQAIEVNADATSNSPRKSGVTLRNLTVDNGATGRSIVVDYSDNVVANNVVTSNNGNDGFTFWYTHDSRAENVTANGNGDNGIYFNGDNNALLHSTANGNSDEGLDVNWYDDIGPSQQRVLVDGVVTRNNGEDDVELHDNGTDDGTAADSKLLKNVDTSSSTAPTSLRLVQVSEGEVQTVNCVFPNPTLDGNDNDVDP